MGTLEGGEGGELNAGRGWSVGQNTKEQGGSLRYAESVL